MAVGRISERLRARLLASSADGIIDVVIEIGLARDAADPYTDLAARYQVVASAIRELAGAEVAIRDGQEPVIAPYIFALLTIEWIVSLADDPHLPIAHMSLNTDIQQRSKDFDAGNLISGVIAEPLASALRRSPRDLYSVIIHLDVRLTTAGARSRVRDEVLAIQARDPSQTVGVGIEESATHPYVFAKMSGYAVLALVDLDRRPEPPDRAIYRIWEDAKIQALITESVATVKADAARIAFSADGKNITWAVVDSGVDTSHPHFAQYGNVDMDRRAPLAHKDFRPGAVGDAGAIQDACGHGTHVAGIIAGTWPKDASAKAVAIVTSLNEAGAEEKRAEELDAIAGMAPRCAIVSLRVLEDDATGRVSALIRAIDQIQQWNDYGRNILVHGINLSLGYPFDPEWFACGQSPICIEVNRLVQSGVAVVVAAGNSGYGYFATEYAGATTQGITMSINDPGNAEYAITVGSTHRTAPHLYGVSYFSSKGPTGDGRLKPDVLAPGERIISCASLQSRTPQTVIESDATAPKVVPGNDYSYKEDTGTSMAAPHVSGIIAGFLSIRREYIGRPSELKDILMKSATDLGRDRTFQGAGLVDLMRAIQSV